MNKLMRRRLPTNDPMPTTEHDVIVVPRRGIKTMEHMFFHSDIVGNSWYQLLENWLLTLYSTPSLLLGFEVNKPCKIFIKTSSIIESIECDIQNIETIRMHNKTYL